MECVLVTGLGVRLEGLWIWWTGMRWCLCLFVDAKRDKRGVEACFLEFIFLHINWPRKHNILM